MRHFCIVFIFQCLLISCISGQVKKVNYHLKFNQSTCLFDCCLIIIEGSTTAPLHRAQFSSQFSLVIPTGSSFEIAELHNPIQNNQQFNGTRPTVWATNSSIIAPEAQPQSDFYSITPSLSPASYYNNLSQGDTVVLFSVSINPIPSCGEDIRIFNNSTDPQANAPGMGGGDFRNGFSLGSILDYYVSNSAPIYPTKPKIESLTTECSSSLNITSTTTVSSCGQSLDYFWTGPNAFSSINEDVDIQNATIFNNGTYKLKITDQLGCTDSLLINAFSKPNGGEDAYISCFETGTATLNAIGSGEWTQHPNNPGLVSIANFQNANTLVSNFPLPGIYYMIWSNPSCSDTMKVVAGENCNCSVINSLVLPQNNQYCGQSGVLVLEGNVISGNDFNYKWIVSVNDGPFVDAIGNQTNQNYTTPNHLQGMYTYKRIYEKNSQPTCRDTSNMIRIIVSPNANAGEDISIDCFETDTVNIIGGPGLWSLAQNSSGQANFSSLTQNTIYISNFSTFGLYNIVRTYEYCKDTATITVGNYCNCDMADGGGSKTGCKGQSQSLIGTCGLGVWSSHPQNSEGSILSQSNNGIANLEFTDLASGVYKYIFTIEDVDADTISISIANKPTIYAGEDFGYCEGLGSVTIAASGGTNYVWSTGMSTSAINVEPSTTTTYIVTGYNSDGCFATDSVTVSIYKRPSGSIPPMQPVTEYDTIKLIAGQWNDAIMFLWSGPNNFSSSQRNPIIPNATFANAGTYTLTIMSEEDCGSTANVQVSIQNAPLAVEPFTLFGKFDGNTNCNNLEWKSNNSAEELSWELMRSSKLDSRWVTISKGISIQGNTQSFIDTEIISGLEYIYQLTKRVNGISIPLSNFVTINTKLSIDNSGNYFEIFPNPASDVIYITINNTLDFSNSLNIKLFNASGTQVKSFKENFIVGTTYSIDTSELPDGVYTIQISDGNNTQIKKCIIFK